MSQKYFMWAHCEPTILAKLRVFVMIDNTPGLYILFVHQLLSSLMFVLIQR